MDQEVVIISKTMIKPRGSTPVGTIALTEWDMVVGRGYVPCVYLYPPSTGRGPDPGLVETLKQSMATALAHFYPLAGRVHLIEGGRMELRCEESTWGAELTEARTPVEMAELGELADVDGRRFSGLIPAIECCDKPLNERPMLLVQVTVFRCGGFSVGLSVCRAVADGLGSLHFFTEWARIARGEAIKDVPVHDRALLQAGEATRKSRKEESVTPPAGQQVMVPPSFPDPREQLLSAMGTPLTTTVMLPLTELQLLRLKHNANNTNDTENNTPPSRCYSRIEALTAHIWRCASKARGHGGKKLNSIGVAIDVRRRITPPLPPNYFGNAVIMVAATSLSEELNSRPLGYACGRVRLAVEAVNEEYVWGDLDYLKCQSDLRVWQGLRTTDGSLVNPDLIVTSWFALPLHGLDFGWGAQAHMAPSVHNMEGFFIILPDRRQGEGARVSMCLQTAHVNSFKTYFYDEVIDNFIC